MLMDALQFRNTLQTYVLANYTARPQCEAELTDLSTVTVNALANISSQSPNRTICDGTNTTFSVAASGPGLAYIWQIDPNTGSWSDLSDGGRYSGSRNRPCRARVECCLSRAYMQFTVWGVFGGAGDGEALGVEGVLRGVVPGA